MYFVELTDTFAGEANYCWVRRYIVKAKTMRGAMRKVSAHNGTRTRKNYGDDESARYDVIGRCMCYFVQWSDGAECETYLGVKTI